MTDSIYKIENPSFLFTPEEFQQAKSEEKLSVKCKCCGKIFSRKKKDIQKFLKHQRTILCCSDKCYRNLRKTSQEPRFYTCKTCGKVFTELPSKAASGDFCSKFCARKYASSFGNTEEKKRQKGQTYSQTYWSSLSKKKKVCKICGQEKCLYPDICKSRFLTNPQHLIKLGLDISKIGTFEIYDEYFKIQLLIYNFYIIQGQSFTDISKKYNFHYSTISNLLKFLKIKIRNNKESVRNYYKHHKHKFTFQNNTQKPCIKDSKIPYKHGWHTSWNNSRHYYRSSYELDYMNLLDKNQIEYQTEPFKIPYFDTQEDKTRYAIPDFLIKETNTLVEIKSTYTYDRQNMIDKMTSYKEKGYNFKLILDHQEYEYCP